MTIHVIKVSIYIYNVRVSTANNINTDAHLNEKVHVPVSTSLLVSEISDRTKDKAPSDGSEAEVKALDDENMSLKLQYLLLLVPKILDHFKRTRAQGCGRNNRRRL